MIVSSIIARFFSHGIWATRHRSPAWPFSFSFSLFRFHFQALFDIKYLYSILWHSWTLCGFQSCCELKFFLFCANSTFGLVWWSLYLPTSRHESGFISILVFSRTFWDPSHDADDVTIYMVRNPWFSPFLSSSPHHLTCFLFLHLYFQGTAGSSTPFCESPHHSSHWYQYFGHFRPSCSHPAFLALPSGDSRSRLLPCLPHKRCSFLIYQKPINTTFSLWSRLDHRLWGYWVLSCLVVESLRPLIGYAWYSSWRLFMEVASLDPL